MTKFNKGKHHSFHKGKFLSFVLRHRPDKLNIELDKEGWTDIDELIRLWNRKHTTPDRQIDRAELQQIVDTNDKKRYKISDDGKRIRASQGHSVKVSLGHKPSKPPDTLFHGTSDRFLDSIKKTGLNKGTRTHVHLSLDHDTAVDVGKRHGKPVVLEVDAAQMYKDGIDFILSDNSVWLVDFVSTKYIKF